MDKEFENSKLLFSTLKMRNLSDMNDLCNFQDSFFLSEIIKNHFETMHDMYGFNPRWYNLASSLTFGLRETVVLDLPTSIETV